MLAGFVDELEKIAVAHGGSHVSKVRQGTRPISVDNLIAKHNAGTLLKRKGPRITDEETAKHAWNALDQAEYEIAVKDFKKDPTWAKKEYGGSLRRVALDMGKPAKKKTADSAGNPQDVRGDSVDDPGAARPPRRAGEVPSKGTGNIPVGEKLGFLKKAVRSEGPGPLPNGESPFAYQEAVKPKKKGDVPSRDDSNVVDRYDARESATTVTGLGQHSSNIGPSTGGGEHT